MTNTRSSGMHIRVNPEIKANAEPILSAIGLSFSDAFNIMLHQISLKGKIPFELSSTRLTENGYTEEFEAELLAVSEEARAAVANGAKTYKKSRKLAKRQGLDMGLLDCHIGGAGDWLLVYEKRDTEMVIHLIDTGKHTDLLG